MLLDIPDRLVTPFKLILLGTVFSAIAYGIVIVLAGNCFHLLLKKRGIYSNRMRIILLFYIAVMLLLSTLALIQLISGIITRIFSSLIWKQPWQLKFYPIEILFVVWGADGFMVRILILRQEQRSTMQYVITDMALSCPASGHV